MLPKLFLNMFLKLLKTTARIKSNRGKYETKSGIKWGRESRFSFCTNLSDIHNSVHTRSRKHSFEDDISIYTFAGFHKHNYNVFDILVFVCMHICRKMHQETDEIHSHLVQLMGPWQCVATGTMNTIRVHLTYHSLITIKNELQQRIPMIFTTCDMLPCTMTGQKFEWTQWETGRHKIWILPNKCIKNSAHLYLQMCTHTHTHTCTHTQCTCTRVCTHTHTHAHAHTHTHKHTHTHACPHTSCNDEKLSKRGHFPGL